MDEEQVVPLKKRALRRYHARVHQRRRFVERGGLKYFGDDTRAIAYLKEQPKRCSCRMCGNPRRFRYYPIYENVRNDAGSWVFVMRRRGYVSEKERLTFAERRANVSFREQLKELCTI